MIKQIKELQIPQWMGIMNYMNFRRQEVNVCRIAHTLDITYSHLSKHLSFFEKKGWLIKKEINKRSKIPYLTKEGKEIAEKCSELISLMKKLS